MYETLNRKDLFRLKWAINQVSTTNRSQDIEFRLFFVAKIGFFRQFCKWFRAWHSFFWIPHTWSVPNQFRKPLDPEMHTNSSEILEYHSLLMESLLLLVEKRSRFFCKKIFSWLCFTKTGKFKLWQMSKKWLSLL